MHEKGRKRQEYMKNKKQKQKTKKRKTRGEKQTEQNGKISGTCKGMKRRGEQIRKTTVNKIRELKWKKNNDNKTR